MLDAVIAAMSVRAGHTFGTDEPFPRLGLRHPTIAPFGVFDCADEHIAIAAGTDSLWADLCTVLDRENLLEDERFEILTDRVRNVTALTEIIEAELAADTADAWIDRLQAQTVPAGPIHDTKRVWTDKHARRHDSARRWIAKTGVMQT